MTTIANDEPIAVAVTEAIRAGDQETLARLLDESPDLATTRVTQSDCDDDVRPTGPGTFPTAPRQ